jgi:hypothetical protein
MVFVRPGLRSFGVHWPPWILQGKHKEMLETFGERLVDFFVEQQAPLVADLVKIKEDYRCARSVENYCRSTYHDRDHTHCVFLRALFLSKHVHCGPSTV